MFSRFGKKACYVAASALLMAPVLGVFPFTDVPLATAALGDASEPAKSCQQIKQANPAAPDGLYWLQGPSMPSAQQYYCDMTTAGGGWQLLFQRAGGTINKETCSGTQKAILNDFLHDGPCGDVNNLAFGDSYNADDVDQTYANFYPVEYLNLQHRSNGVVDTDDAYILHTTANIFPNSPSPTTVIDTPIDQICDVNNANCDNTDVYWKYIGNSWFHSSVCHAGNAASNTAYHGNYGYCHNGWTGVSSNSLFGNRNGYNETKLYDHAGGSRHYTERVFIKSGDIPPAFDAVAVTSNNAKNTAYAKAGDAISVDLALRAADTWRNNYNRATFSIGGTTGLQTPTYPGSGTPKLSDSVDYTVLAGQNGSLNVTALDFQNTDNSAITGFSAPYIPTPNVTIDTIAPAISLSDDVSATATTSDTIQAVVTDANPDAASYHYGFSGDATCDASDSYPNSFTSGTGFTITDSTNNGNYLCFMAEDMAGNVSYLASANPLLVGQDTATPAAAPDLVASSDTGASDSDDITNDNTPTVEVSCIASSTVALYINAVANGQTATCSAMGNAQFTIGPALADGGYDLTFTQQQPGAGYFESGQSPVLHIAVDTVAPVNLTSTIDTASPQDIDNPHITFSAQDAASGIDHYTLQFDGGAATTATSPHEPSLTPASSHDVVITAYDVAGNTTVSSVSYPPVVNITSPTVMSSGTITDTTIQVTGPNPIQSVTASGAGYSNLNCSPALPHAVPINCTVQVSTTGTLTVSAVDSSGATGTSTRDYTIDTVGPTLSFTDDVQAGPVSADTVAITVGDANPNTASYHYGFSGDATCDASDSYPNSFTSGTPFAISNENHNGQYICAVAEDMAGNTAYAASAQPLNIDVTPPTATFANSTDNPTNGDVTVTMTASEAIQIPAGWTQVNSTTYTKVLAQNQTLNFVIRDPLNNQSNVSHTVSNIDKQPPVVTLAGDNPMIVSLGQSFTDPGATCTDNTSCTVTVSGTVDTATTGTYTVTYTVTDPAGNTVVATRTVEVKPDIDGDGIIDSQDPDIDGDGIPNEQEQSYGTDPYNVNSRPQSTVDLSQAEPSSANSPTFSDAVMSVTDGLCNNIASVQSLATNGVSAGATVDIVAGVSFELTCAAVGENATVEFALGEFYNQPETLSVYKQENGQLTDITSQVSLHNSGGKTILRYSLVDGATFDDDNQANAQILDPIYIGVPRQGLAQTGSGAYGYLFVGIILMAAGALSLRVSARRG